MMRRIVPLALLLLTAQAAPPAPPPAPVPAATEAGIVRVAVTTTMGPMVFALEAAKAPATVANFLRYVDARRYDGTEFYRAMVAPWGGGLVQAGVRDAAKLYPPVRHEPTSQTGLTHKAEGALSMARLEPGSARSDFTIMLGDMSGLDAREGDPGFAVFGRVVEGMDVVRRILAAPTSATRGEGVMRGQMLEPGVRIVQMRRLRQPG